MFGGGTNTRRVKGTMIETRLTARCFISAFPTRAYSEEERKDEKTQDGARKQCQTVSFQLQAPSGVLSTRALQ